jgi:hypothetical protein
MGGQLSGSLAPHGADLGGLSETILSQEKPIGKKTPIVKRFSAAQTLSVSTEPCQEGQRWVQEGKLLRALVGERSQAQMEFLTSKNKRSKSSMS